MGQQHELLATRETHLNATAAMVSDTLHKFGKVDQFFRGQERTLKMLESNPANDAVEKAAHTSKVLTTTVVETLDYLFKNWADTEDVLFQINKTNQLAKANVEFRGQLLLKDVPVDELLGLESRIESIRKLIIAMPTLDSSKQWTLDLNAGMRGVYRAVKADETTKSEKRMVPIILAPATDKHPAQVKEGVEDRTVGLFTDQFSSGACTSKQKADVLAVIDDLMVEFKKSRMRANTQEACKEKIGAKITALLMEPFKV